MDHYFESSYLTWEITSVANLEFITATFKHLTDLEDNEVNTWKHTETSDYFFQQRPIGGSRPFPVSALHISIADFVATLIQFGLGSEEKNAFVTDQQMDQYRQNIQGALCFSNASYAIFCCPKKDIVDSIWLDYDDHLALENDTASIAQLLYQLGKKYSLILVDWYEKSTVDLSDQAEILYYLSAIRP